MPSSRTDRTCHRYGESRVEREADQIHEPVPSEAGAGAFLLIRAHHFHHSFDCGRGIHWIGLSLLFDPAQKRRVPIRSD
jgi:hypothetical protein